MDIRSAFDMWVGVESLSGNNKYFCDRCDGYVVANKRVCVHQAPTVLVIQLQRFVHTGHGVHKDGRQIRYTEELDITPWTSEFLCKARKSDDVRYRLYGIVIHRGSTATMGHYVSYVRISDRWFYFDDKAVARATVQDALNQAPYMLFYQRVHLARPAYQALPADARICRAPESPPPVPPKPKAGVTPKPAVTVPPLPKEMGVPKRPAGIVYGPQPRPKSAAVSNSAPASQCTTPRSIGPSASSAHTTSASAPQSNPSQPPATPVTPVTPVAATVTVSKSLPPAPVAPTGQSNSVQSPPVASVAPIVTPAVRKNAMALPGKAPSLILLASAYADDDEEPSASPAKRQRLESDPSDEKQATNRTHDGDLYAGLPPP
eukprot:TRINITY_DN21418_c0_g1_i4.p1 TRINITY_DN21418_c0_g1~~TRINITY_DN21418_c0_g1_i4.p1  ORF type:complete len:375 (-),score=23.46 TRINITY_DN21418_c0_g1_i4:10-1134(-)